MNRTMKLLVIALVVSATINVFFVGFAVARLARRGRGGGGHGPPGIDADSAQPSEVGPGGQLRERWRDRMTALGSRREAIGAARGAVRQAFLAEPFSAEVLRASLEALRTETNGAQTALDQALVEFASSLSPDERKRFADSPWFAGRGGFGGRFAGPRGL